MTNRDDLQLTVYLDPNYDPIFSYSQLESWLLLYDKIYISSPSPHQVHRAQHARNVPPVSAKLLQRLVREKWVVPIGRPRFFDPSWRASRALELSDTDPVRAAHFSWSDEFDSAMATHARHLPDSELDTAIETGTSLKDRHPDAFETVRRRVEALRAEGVLPAKFYSPSEAVKSSDDIATGVLYEVAGDLWARRHLATSGLIVPTEQAPIYSLLDRASTDEASPFQPSMRAPDERPGEGLSEQDLALARELAERISRDYTISDVLEEYRQGALQREFRAFALKAIEDVSGRVDRIEDTGPLWPRFQAQLATIEMTRNAGGYLTGFVSAAAALHPNVEKLLAQGLTRRSLLMLAVCHVTGLAGKPLLGPTLDWARSAVAGSEDRWISLIASKASRR